MRWFDELRQFVLRVWRGQVAPQGRVEDSAEFELERERRRGMRGD